MDECAACFQVASLRCSDTGEMYNIQSWAYIVFLAIVFFRVFVSVTEDR